MPLLAISCLAELAAIRLARGRAEDALATAREGRGLCELIDGDPSSRSALLRVVYAEALQATGQRDEARVAIAIAWERLLVNADKIGDPELRRTFLENVPENARILALAREWLGDEAPSGALKPQR